MSPKAYANERHLHVRADASADIGIGHFMRCFALAQHWREHEGEVTFIGSFPPALGRLLDSHSIHQVQMPRAHPDPHDIEMTCAVLPEDVPVIVDGYTFDSGYQKRLASDGRYLMVIDDTGHLSDYAGHVLFNQNLDAERIAYRRAPRIRLLGPKYALLRAEFIGQAATERTHAARASQLLVTLGGADPDNTTLRILEILAEEPIDGISLRVVIGAANRHRDELRDFCGSRLASAELITDSEDMLTLMQEADFAISAAGGTCWELAIMRVPMILLAIAPNQVANGAGLKARGAAQYLGESRELRAGTLRRSVQELAANRNARAALAAGARGLVDGMGCTRVAATLKERA